MEQVAVNGFGPHTAEEVEAVVVREPAPLPASRTTGQVVRAQAVVAAGSFAVGAATAVVVAQRRARRASAKAGRRRRTGGLDVAASRSFSKLCATVVW